MRRTMFAALIAASLGLPAVALAKQAVGLNTNTLQPQQQVGQFNWSQQNRDRFVRPHDTSANGTGTTIGGGMDAGNEIGHVTGPGNSPIDDSTRGPINDVQPGRGSADTHQSANPKPAY